MTRYNMIRREVHSPKTAFNDTDRWMAEVRKNGILANYRYFDTELEASSWVRHASTKTSKKVIKWMANVMREHGR